MGRNQASRALGADYHHVLAKVSFGSRRREPTVERWRPYDAGLPYAGNDRQVRRIAAAVAWTMFVNE